MSGALPMWDSFILKYLFKVSQSKVLRVWATNFRKNQLVLRILEGDFSPLYLVTVFRAGQAILFAASFGCGWLISCSPRHCECGFLWFHFMEGGDLL